MSLDDFLSEDFGRPRALVDAADDRLAPSWRDGEARPYQILAVLDEFATGAGRSPNARLSRVYTRVALAYGISESDLQEACEAVSPANTSFLDVAIVVAPEEFE
jgi:hypothetical protein